LNCLLSPPYKVDRNRQFWLGQVSSFHTYYINKRTHVLDVLERTERTALIRTSLLLMDLNLFFNRLHNGNPGSECWSIAQKTQLLPMSETERKVKESEYRELDPLLQDSVPFLLVGVMEILSNDYSNLKRDVHRDTSGVVRERLQELKESARLLTSFASSIGITHHQMGILTQLMSLMI
jgi:hypothetical protein